MPIFGPKRHDDEQMERILAELKSINEHERKIIMLLTELAAAITTADNTVNQIAAAIGINPTGTVPQAAVDALTKLNTDLTALQALVTPGVPAVPTGLTATPGAASVALSWSPSPGAVSYNVKSSPTTGGPYTTLTPAPTSPSFTDTTAKTGVPGFYVVSAVNAVGESKNSVEVTATAS